MLNAGLKQRLLSQQPPVPERAPLELTSTKFNVQDFLSFQAPTGRGNFHRDESLTLPGIHNRGFATCLAMLSSSKKRGRKKAIVQQKFW